MDRRVGFLLLLAILLISRWLAACSGGGDHTTTPPPTNPVPTVSSVKPSSAVAGGAGFTLTVNGTNFITSSVVQWNGSARPTTLVSNTQLQAQISASDISGPAAINVTVLNPRPGGGTSGNAAFTVASVGVTQTISVTGSGAMPNANSHEPALNLNARFIAFGSEATNLITPNAQFAEAYLRDTCIGAGSCTASTVLVSAISGTSTEGNGLGGAGASISADGRFVGFLSTASNLVSPNTVSGQYYVRDDCVSAAAGCVQVTALASVNQGGSEPNAGASDAMLASHSCNVAFVSLATDVVSGVTIPGEIYLSSCSSNNLAAGFSNTILVSADNVNLPANQGAQQPAISGDGRFVAFTSTSSNLPGSPGGGLGGQNVFVRDTCIGAASCTPGTTMVSLDSIGNAIAGNSQTPAISDNGRFVAFNTFMVVAGGNTNVVFLRDTCNSSAGPVAACVPSTNTIAQGPANTASNSTNRALSADGRFVVFDSNVANLVNTPTVGNQVYVRDTCMSSAGPVAACTPKTVLLSVDSTGTPVGGGSGAISRDGHFAAFEQETTIFQIFLAATGF